MVKSIIISLNSQLSEIISHKSTIQIHPLLDHYCYHYNYKEQYNSSFRNTKKSKLNCDIIYIPHYTKLTNRYQYLTNNYLNKINCKTKFIKFFDKESLYRNKMNLSYIPGLITIITPTYNQSKFIRKTLDSIKTQSYLKIEHIILDNNSSDDTEQIITDYITENKDRYKIIYIRTQDYGQARSAGALQPAAGQVYAINKGLLISSGDIITWLNSGDHYDNEYVLENIINNFNKNIDIVYGKGYYINDNYKIISDAVVSDKLSKDKLFNECPILQPSVFIKRKVFILNGLLNDHFNLAFDFEYWIRLIFNDTNKVKFKYIDYYISRTILPKECDTIFSRLDKIKEAIEIVYIYYNLLSKNFIKDYILTKYNELTNELIDKYTQYFYKIFQYSYYKRFITNDISDIKNLSDSEISLYLKYIDIFHDILINNYNNVLILEDDVILSNYFTSKLNYILSLENDYNLIHLSNNKMNYHAKIQHGRYLYNINYLPNTSGFVIQYNFVKKIFDKLFIINKPIDLKITEIVNKLNFNIYWCEPKLCIEAPFYKSSILHSDYNI